MFRCFPVNSCYCFELSQVTDPKPQVRPVTRKSLDTGWAPVTLTAHPTPPPSGVPSWGDDLYFFSERRTAKARYVAANPQVVVHLESAEDVVIVNGHLEDVGVPQQHPDVLRALEAKYSSPEDAQYLPTADPDFDVLWLLHPTRAMLWRLDDYDASQARWRRA